MDAASAISDEQLMSAYRDADAGAFDLLYARYKDEVYRFLLRNTGDAEVAAELHQDVWMKVINARLRYRAQALFRTWLYTIVHNRLTDHYRSRAREMGRITPLAGDEEVCDSAPLPAELAERAEVRAAFLTALAELPALQREAWLLHEESGLTLEQIAEVVGSSRETIKSRLRYAVNKLRGRLRSLQ